MRTCVKWTLMLLLAMLMAAALTLFSAATGGDVTESPYDLYVGYTPVTPDNCADILGDGTAGYDPASKTLTIRNFRSTQALDNDGALFSILGGAKVTVVITGEQGNNFPFAIFLKAGDIRVTDTTVKFGANCFLWMVTEDGNITVENSTVESVSIERVIQLCIQASNVTFQNSTLSLVTEEGSLYPTSLFYAGKQLTIADSDVTVSMPYPLAEYIFYCDTGSIAVRDSTMTLSKGNTCFWAPEGSLTVSKASVSVTDFRHFARSDRINLTNATIDAAVYFNGLILLLEKDGKSYITDSDIRMTNLSFAQMQERLLQYVWADMAFADKQEYGSYEAFTAAVRTNLYEPGVRLNYALGIQNGQLTMTGSTFQSTGFAVGMAGLYDVTMSISKLSKLDISSRLAAVIVISNTRDALSFGSGYMDGRAKLRSVNIGAQIDPFGKYFYSFTDSKLTHDIPADAESLDEIVLAMQGFSPKLSLRTSPYFRGWVWGVGITGLCLGAIGILYVTMILPEHRERKPKAEKK
ncbi:MAG: hypothetical protein WDA00_04855 [Eubacteriales bacterium]